MEDQGWSGGPNRQAAWGYLRKVLDVGVLVVFVLLISWLFVKTLDYTLPFVIGILVAVVLQPITAFFERKGASRTVAILSSMVVIIGIIVAVLSYIAVKIAQEAAILSQNIPRYSDIWGEWLQNIVRRSESLYGQLPPKVTTAMRSSVANLVDHTRDMLTHFFTDTVHVVASLPDCIVIIVIGLLAAYFFLHRKEKLIHGLSSLMPPGWDAKVLSVVSDVNRAFMGLLRAQIILVLLTMVISVIGLFIIGVNYAVTIGLLIGISGLLPIVGSAIVTIPWAGFALITGNVGLGLKLLILQAVISLVRHIVEPKILAHSVGLDTLSTLFAMYVGLKVFGVFGLFFGPLILIALKSLLRAKMFVDFLPDDTWSREKHDE